MANILKNKSLYQWVWNSERPDLQTLMANSEQIHSHVDRKEREDFHFNFVSDMVKLPQSVLEAEKLHRTFEWQQEKEPLTNKFSLLGDACHFGPQRLQCYPAAATKTKVSSFILVVWEEKTINSTRENRKYAQDIHITGYVYPAHV
jgi:hypothetical protein